MYPRHTAEFGDILEETVGIGCPVVTEYLFREDAIEFDFGTCEMEKEAEPIDFDLYDGLSCVRTNLIETYQNYGRICPTGAAFMLVACMIQIKEAFITGRYSKAWALQFAQESFSEGFLQDVFAREEAMSKPYSEKAEVISFIWRDWESWLRVILEKYT